MAINYTSATANVSARPYISRRSLMKYFTAKNRDGKWFIRASQISLRYNQTRIRSSTIIPTLVRDRIFPKFYFSSYLMKKFLNFFNSNDLNNYINLIYLPTPMKFWINTNNFSNNSNHFPIHFINYIIVQILILRSDQSLIL